MSEAIVLVGCWPRWISADLAAAHDDEPSFASIRAFDFSVLRTGMPQRPDPRAIPPINGRPQICCVYSNTRRCVRNLLQKVKKRQRWAAA
jgi:hypothetical protein